MKKLTQFLAIILFIVLSTTLQAQTIQLANGWKLNPAGTSFALGDLPLNIEVSSTGKYMAVTNNGQGYQSIELIDTKSEKIIDKNQFTNLAGFSLPRFALKIKPLAKRGKACNPQLK